MLRKFGIFFVICLGKGREGKGKEKEREKERERKGKGKGREREGKEREGNKERRKEASKEGRKRRDRTLNTPGKTPPCHLGSSNNLEAQSLGRKAQIAEGTLTLLSFEKVGLQIEIWRGGFALP
jgi:hypothetical protein